MFWFIFLLLADLVVPIFFISGDLKGPYEIVGAFGAFILTIFGGVIHLVTMFFLRQISYKYLTQAKSWGAARANTLIIIVILLWTLFLVVLPKHGTTLAACDQPTEEELVKKMNLKKVESLGETSSIYAQYYSDGNNVYEIIQGTPCGIEARKTVFDGKTFKILNKRYAKSAGKIYYEEKPVVNVDYDSFATFNVNWTDGLAKDNSHVFYLGTILDGADPLTFTPIPLPRSNALVFLAKDKTYLYDFVHLFSANSIQKIDFIDTATFEGIGGEGGPIMGYYRDKNNVYYYNNGMNLVVGVKPGAFRMTGKDSIATDGKNFYEYGKIYTNQVIIDRFLK